MTTPGPDVSVGDVRAPVIPLVLIGIGGWFLWFGVRYFGRSRSDVGMGSGTLWPSDPLKSALQGKGIPAPGKPATTAAGIITADLAQAAAAQQQATGQNVTQGTSGHAGGTPTGRASAAVPGSVNQNLGKLLAARYGWAAEPYWSALVSLWDSESGWSNTIWNVSASCGGGAYAYGIPQACGHGTRQSIAGHGSVCPYPAGNMGNPPACGGTSDPTSQINWGLAYIKANYGDPTRVPHGGY